MKTWIDRLLAAAVLFLVSILVVSTIPWITEGHMEGQWLLLHMFASGALVVSLPLLALFMVWPNLSRFKSGGLQRLGFWSLMLTGLATIATVFLCMLPIPSTDQMHELMRWHGYAGFGMLPALLVLVWGTTRWRRMNATRSATPG